MLTILSNEVDIEMSEHISENLTDYKIPNNNDDDDCVLSSVNELSAITKKTNSSNVSSQSYSYYDRRSCNLTYTDSKEENDHFDANNLRGMYNDIDFTGDKIDSSESHKIHLDSQHAYEQAIKLNQLRREIVCQSKPDFQNKKTFDKNFLKSENASLKKRDQLISTKKSSPSCVRGIRNKSNCRRANLKEVSDKDSITLLIRVPRNKLIDHIKNKSFAESWKAISPKSSSCESLSSSSNDRDSDTLLENIDSPENSSNTSKSHSLSESSIRSFIEKSKEKITNKKTSLTKSNKKLQTNPSNLIQSSKLSDKNTQTLNSFRETVTNDSEVVENYFLCNICHKIVPANLSPVCLKLPCSAIKRCDLIFHGELDLIMHLPVKHTNEFASYHICSKCNRMYHPSNIVTMKGCYTCLDCVTVLAQLTITE